MKRVLFMSESEARTTLYCAGYSGEYEFYVVGNLARNQTIQFHPMCTKFIDLRNELKYSNHSQELVDELMEIVRSEKIDVLLPVSIACAMIIDDHLDYVQEHVRVTPFPSKKSMDVLDNKYHFYQFCTEQGIAHPESCYVEQYEQIDAMVPGVNYPLLIKPVLGAGGFDTLVYVENQDSMEQFLQRPAAKKSGYFPALLQEYFEGEDIDFNGFANNGEVLASSVMRTDYNKKNKELSVTYFVEDKSVLELGKKMLEATNYSGPANIDLRIRQSDGKLMAIEVNPRYWARVNVSLMDGMNFLDVAIKSALGQPVESVSRTSSKKWLTSLSPLFKTLIVDRDVSTLKYFLTISAEQIKYWVYQRRFYAHASRMLGK